MSQILHGTDALVRLPGRTLTRQENGIVELSCTYACKTSLAASFRSLFDVGKPMPGETGFTIKYNFTETTRADGFTEFSVTSTGDDPSQPSTGQSALKVQEGRTVQTFPSGLVRVERTYICPTTSEATFRPTLAEGNILPFDDGTPAIDGLYIFPTPNETRRDDGFTEFRVTAYGRVTFSGTLEKSTAIGSLGEISVTIQQNGTGASSSFDQVCINEVYTFRKVFPSDESISNIIVAPSIENPAVYLLDKTIISRGTKVTRNVTVDNIIDIVFTNFSSTNYGRFSEWVYSYETRATRTTTTRN